jgi:hypothetical protein
MHFLHTWGACAVHVHTHTCKHTSLAYGRRIVGTHKACPHVCLEQLMRNISQEVLWGSADPSRRVLGRARLPAAVLATRRPTPRPFPFHPPPLAPTRACTDCHHSARSAAYLSRLEKPSAVGGLRPHSFFHILERPAAELCALFWLPKAVRPSPLGQSAVMVTPGKATAPCTAGWQGPPGRLWPAKPAVTWSALPAVRTLSTIPTQPWSNLVVLDPLEGVDLTHGWRPASQSRRQSRARRVAEGRSQQAGSLGRSSVARQQRAGTGQKQF